ncbi:MAG: hypothetical protein JSS28_10900 [Proteobacteria bacterium]|nr:hypothetical protein [Pseudomonadota bacterium]
MKITTLLSCIIAATALATAADGRAANAAGAAPQVDLARAQQVRAQMQAQANQARDAAQKTGAAGARLDGAKPAELFANPYRAYPPSCLNSPMPFGLWHNDPNALHTTLNLIGDPLSGDAGERAYVETANVYVFRVVCTSGKSATLLEIDRPSSMEGNTSRYPSMPGVYVSQSGLQDYVARVADDPNTFFSTVYALNPLVRSDVFILENFYGGAVQFNYNNSVTVTVDNLAAGTARQVVDFPLGAYNPAQYAQASQALPISGYMTGAWYDPAHSGEGIQVEVGEQGTPGAANDRYLVIAWYTYDPLGFPYWLYGAGNFTSGDRAATVSMVYSTGGGFAGSFASAITPAWGTINVQFPDCNTMQFNYQSTSGLPAGVPTGNGAKTWTRISQMNGLTCQ